MVAASTDEGHESCLAHLYLQHADSVYRYFYHHVHHVHDAEDLTATAFSKAISSIHRYSPERGTLAAWLFGIAHRTLADYLRRPRRPPPAMGEADSRDNPETLVSDAEQATIVRKRLEQLPGEQQEAIVLRFFAGLSVRDTAKVMGKSEAACKMLVHRGLLTLRSWYETERCFEERAEPR